MNSQSSNVTRRGWLLRSLQVAVAATVAAISYPVVRFLRPRAATVSGSLEAVAPFRVNEIAQAANNPFNFAGRPCLVVITPEGAKRLAAGQKLQTGDVKALNAVCTHVQCTVKFRPDKGDIFCNCHEGIFDLSGRNVSGPPPRPLETYKVVLRGEEGREEIIISRES